MNSSRGNVLFLILIAVALFAALSYAVTTSSRSGGGNISKEKAQLIVSQLEQYTSSLSSAVTRMTLTGGMTLDQIGFNCVDSYSPMSFSNHGACTSPYSKWSDAPPASLKYEVFHPSGGGVSPLTPLALGIGLKNVEPDGYPLTVHGYLQIHGIGSTTTSNSSGVDLVLVELDIPKTVCQVINDKAGISGIPIVSMPYQDAFFANDSKASGFPFELLDNLGDSASPQFYGKPMGCMEHSGFPGVYGFYSVIRAR